MKLFRSVSSSILHCHNIHSFNLYLGFLDETILSNVG